MSVKNYLKKKKNQKTPEEAMAKVLSMVETIKGEKGDKGDDGKTPIKFKDYFTKLDIKGIVKQVQSLIRIPRDGKDGGDGKDGKNGKDGKSIKGDTGEKGKDGNIIKPEEIATKLNTLEEKVDMKVIKGLKTYLKKLETNIFYKGGGGKGGGGLGQPQHETFAIGSTTTSITTTYKIAAEGRAVFGMRYEGQTLHWGEHYTVSGKTITLLFTPVDTTNIDLTYIRT